VRRRLENLLPSALAVSLLVLVALLGARACERSEGLSRALREAATAVYLVWIVVETVTTTVAEWKRERAKGDRGTLEVYALARGLVAVSTLVWSNVATDAVSVLGLCVLISGIVLRGAAIRTLGELYSHRVRLVPGSRVVERGVYALVRHPAYLGMLLAHLGWVLVFASVPGAIVLLAGLLPAIVSRIKTEERVLMPLEGYARYAGRKPRLLPGVW